jgi:hypothetical protein
MVMNIFGQTMFACPIYQNYGKMIRFITNQRQTDFLPASLELRSSPDIFVFPNSSKNAPVSEPLVYQGKSILLFLSHAALEIDR